MSKLTHLNGLYFRGDVTNMQSLFVFLLQGSQHSGSSLSLASTKVCSSMDEADGAGSEGEEDEHQLPASALVKHP